MKPLVERLGQDAAWNTHTVLNGIPKRPKFMTGQDPARPGGLALAMAAQLKGGPVPERWPEAAAVKMQR